MVTFDNLGTVLTHPSDIVWLTSRNRAALWRTLTKWKERLCVIALTGRHYVVPFHLHACVLSVKQTAKSALCCAAHCICTLMFLQQIHTPKSNNKPCLQFKVACFRDISFFNGKLWGKCLLGHRGLFHCITASSHWDSVGSLSSSLNTSVVGHLKANGSVSVQMWACALK